MLQSVKMSARKMQEILSGEITADQHFASYGRPGEPINNPLASARKAGLTIETIRITKIPDGDDDEVEVWFSLPDPAVTRFKVGSSEGKS